MVLTHGSGFDHIKINLQIILKCLLNQLDLEFEFRNPKRDFFIQATYILYEYEY